MKKKEKVPVRKQPKKQELSRPESQEKRLSAYHSTSDQISSEVKHADFFRRQMGGLDAVHFAAAQK